MKFYLPVGGIIDSRFGILTNYNHKSIPLGIINGMEWGGDVPVFGAKGFEPTKWIPWLDIIKPYLSTCRFMCCPDVVGDARKTLIWYNTWRSYINGWPVAFVGQDGQENLDFPDPLKWDVLFVGGSTEWKCSQAAVDCIKYAQSLGKKIHIGRVNWGRRYRHFRLLDGSEEFTCDGTRTRFDGVGKTILSWSGYQSQDSLFKI